MTAWFGQRLSVVEAALAAVLVLAIAAAIHYSVEFAATPSAADPGVRLSRARNNCQREAALH